jgi:hypothetical protein
MEAIALSLKEYLEESEIKINRRRVYNLID